MRFPLQSVLKCSVMNTSSLFATLNFSVFLIGIGVDCSNMYVWFELFFMIIYVSEQISKFSLQSLKFEVQSLTPKPPDITKKSFWVNFLNRNFFQVSKSFTRSGHFGGTKIAIRKRTLSYTKLTNVPAVPFKIFYSNGAKMPKNSSIFNFIS